jgi:hypothetical protein
MKEGDSMEIGPLSNDPRPQIENTDDQSATNERENKMVPTAATSDSVRISADARAQLASITADVYKKHGPRIDREDLAAKSEFMGAARPLDRNMSSTDRVEILRQRIEQGFYDRPEVKDEIARRLSGGDVKPPDKDSDNKNNKTD